MKIFKKCFARKKVPGFAAAVAASLLIFFAAGCSKISDAPTISTRDLGTIELRAAGAKSIDLGDRKELSITTSDATNDDFSISMTLTVRSFSGVVDNEQTKSAHFTAHSGRKSVARLGDSDFQFTPVLTHD